MMKDILGSDGNTYTVHSIPKFNNRIELQIIAAKTDLNKDYYYQSALDVNKMVVEKYIEKTKSKYSLPIRKAFELKHLLNRTQINNHFDYLALLHKVNPLLDELLQ